MFKKVVSMSLAVVTISLCATGEVVPQNLGSIKVTTPMYTADQVDEIVSEGGQSRVALTNGTIYINGETITPLPTTMTNTTATVEKLSIVYPGWDTNNIAPIRIKHNEDGSFDLQIIGTNTYLFGANGANLYWGENSIVSLNGTNELSGFTRITQDFVSPAFRIPRNEYNLHASRKFRFNESANARIEIGGQGEMRVDSPDYIKFGGIDWSENLWNASNKTLTAYISDRLEDFSKNGTVPAIKSNDGSYMIDATGRVWRITLVENISDWVLGGDGYLTTGSDNYPIWYYSTRWYEWYWTVTNNESVITIDMPAEGWSAQYMVDVNYDYYATSLGMWLLYETDEEYEELIQKGFPEDLDFTRTVVRYYTTNLVGKIALEEDVRNYNDISVDTNTWYLLKPDSSVEPMIFAQQTPRYIRWSTEDGNFDLNLMFRDSTWVLTVNSGHAIVVTNSMDVTSLEFTNYVPPYGTYHVIRGSRLVLNTEIPQNYSTVSNAAMNAMPRAEARFTPWKPYEEPGAPAGYQLVSAVYSGNRWHLKIMVDGETTPTTYTTDDSMDAVMITFDGELNSLVRSRLASVDDLDDYAQSMARNMRNLIDLDLYMPSDWYYGDIVAFAYDKEVDRWIGTNGLSFSSGHLIKYDNTAGEWIYYNDIYGESYPEQRINGSLSDVSLDLGSAIIERETAFIKIEGKLATTNDLASALATYETVSNAAMSALSRTEAEALASTNYVNSAVSNKVSKTGNETISGTKSFTTGINLTGTFRNGNGVTTTGSRSHAQGLSSTAIGDYSHAEGDDTKAIGNHSHAEGYLSESRGIDSHAEGHSTIASGKRAHAEGFQTSATNNQSHAEGRITVAGGYHSHAEGRGSIALGDQSHAEGAQTIAAGHQSHTDGFRAMSAEQGESVNDIVNPHSGAYVWQGMPDTVSLVTDIAAEDALTPGQRLAPEELTNTYYHSHGVGTFNIKPVGGLDGFWIGETNFTDHVATLIAASSKNSIQKAQDWVWGDVVEGSRIYLGNFNNDDSYSKEFLFEDAKNQQVWVFPAGQQTNTIAYKSDITASIAASSTAVFSSPQQQLDGWTLPEYISALSKYKWDTQTRTCYREFVENDMLILRAVTNIDLTAVGNIDALKTMEDSIEIRKPPVAQVCYSVGYESRDNVLVATNANFKIDGNYLSEATITMSYDVSGTTTAEIISPTAITATSESITIAESALATAMSEIGRTITFTIQTAYGHTSITAVVAEPPTP